MNTFAIQISIALDIKKEGDWFVAWSPALDVSSQGRTENEAYANAQEALQLFLETCFAMGTLNQVLKARGLQPSIKQRQPHPEIAGKGRTLGDLVSPIVDEADWECFK